MNVIDDTIFHNNNNNNNLYTKESSPEMDEE